MITQENREVGTNDKSEDENILPLEGANDEHMGAMDDKVLCDVIPM